MVILSDPSDLGAITVFETHGAVWVGLLGAAQQYLA